MLSTNYISQGGLEFTILIPSDFPSLKLLWLKQILELMQCFPTPGTRRKPVKELAAGCEVTGEEAAKGLGKQQSWSQQVLAGSHRTSLWGTSNRHLCLYLVCCQLREYLHLYTMCVSNCIRLNCGWRQLPRKPLPCQEGRYPKTTPGEGKQKEHGTSGPLSSDIGGRLWHCCFFELCSRLLWLLVLLGHSRITLP